MKKQLIIISIVFVIGLIFSNCIGNQIYQWTDKNGIKHFSNTPPDTEETLKVTNEIPFKDYDIETDKAAAMRKTKLDGRKGVPYALINGQGIHGWSEKQYAKALGLQ